MVNQIFVITGGPGTGKTATIAEMKKRGYKVLPEAARKIATTDKRFLGKSIKEINVKQFQKAIFDFQKKKIKEIFKLKVKKTIFSDRGLGDTLAYYIINNLRIPKNKLEYAKKIKYAGVFILDFLDFYETDELRTESKPEQERIQKEITRLYKKLGYSPIQVPFDSVKKRANFILREIEKISL